MNSDNNLDFTFLAIRQCLDGGSIDIIKKYGTKCEQTDFTILLGCEASLRDRNCTWYTRSSSRFNDVFSFDWEGNMSWENPRDRTRGFRPAFSYSLISSILSNKVRWVNGILEVEYGEYPQTIVSEDFAIKLENAFLYNKINKTGKIYTTDSVEPQNLDTPFQPRRHLEYEYNGKKYIRFVSNISRWGCALSDGRQVEKGKPYWIEVEPIKWMIDEKENIALSKKVLFSGIQFNSQKYNDRDFFISDIKQFMDTYFAKDIIPSERKKLTLEDKKKLAEERQKEIKRKNPYGFNFEKASEEQIIRGAIESGVAVFLHGQSSEGKSARVKQIDPECVIIYLRNATPESLNGKSVYNSETGEMIDVKPTWLKKLEERCEKEPDKYHIVFLDEITNALPSIQGIAFNIVLDREVNGIWKLPENARIVAAGNDMKDSLAANQLAEPLFNRFAHVYIKTTVENWLKWASENNIHPAIYAYIAYKKGEVLRSKYDGEKPNADPRKWEMASKMLYATGQPEMLRALIGEEITREFVGFCNQRVITLEDVLKGDYTEKDLEMDTSEIYATTMGLSQVDEANFEKVREFVLKLGGEPCALFDSLWAHGDEKRIEIVAELRMSTGNKTR